MRPAPSAPRLWRWGEPEGPLRETLARGGILAIPTESSYGLAVDPRSPEGVELVNRVKGRQTGKPMPVVVADRRQVQDLGGVLEPPELEILSTLWPAALSLVLPIRRPLPAAGGHGSLAFRVPAHSRLRGLLQSLGSGLTATSANLRGGRPVCTPGELQDLLAGRDAVVVDGGELPGGKPSTLVAAGEEGGLVILRHGRYPIERLREMVPEIVDQATFSATIAEIPADRNGSAA